MPQIFTDIQRRGQGIVNLYRPISPLPNAPSEPERGDHG